MAPRHAYSADGDTLSATADLPSRDHLALAPPIYLTYADGVELRRTGALWRRAQRRFPAGLVHAAHLHSPLALCGVPVESLESFGRSRHPFEQFAAVRRCTRCHTAAGRPTA